MQEKIFARAQPESVRFTEKYYYEQEISRNPSIQTGDEPKGSIRINIPYDGYDFFTRQALKDVEEQLKKENSTEKAVATVGYLALSDQLRTDSTTIQELNDRYRTIELKVPVVGDGIDETNNLVDDKHSCVIQYAYLPSRPEIMPVGVEMKIYDEEELTPPSSDLPKDQLSEVAHQITQQINFQRSLMAEIRIKFEISNELVSKNVELKPKVRRFCLNWPSITSFYALDLIAQDGKSNKKIPVNYNPANRSLEWKHIQMKKEDKPTNAEVQTYYSDWLILYMSQPGELYQQFSIDGEVEIEITKWLLSGLQVRLFNGLGKQEPGFKRNLATLIITKLHLILDDAFSRRMFSPYQQLHFEGIIPNDMRIADIRTTLDDRGFRIESTLDGPLPSEGKDELRHFLLAHRPEGPDRIELWVFVEGKKYTTTRQTEVQGGQVFTSEFESGELNVYVRAQFPGNSRIVTREMNAIQAALKDRFERLRAKR